MEKSKSTIENFDIIIIGGGQSGLTLAAITGAAGIKTACIDRDDPARQIDPNFDFRTTAISYGSSDILERADIWHELQSGGCPIESIDILDSGSPVLLNFLANDAGEDAFGWIINNLDMRRALHKRIEKLPEASHIAPDGAVSFEAHDDYIEVHLASGRILRGKLLIGADGRGSFVRKTAGIDTRKWRYSQQAMICTVEHENPHNNIAIEHFKAEGPFAVLPMVDDEKTGKHYSSLVWTEDLNVNGKPKPNSALNLSEDAFNVALNERFPDFYGQVKAASPRRAFPLSLEHARDYIAPRLCLIADAAHGIHPIAGQGLNLGMRDIDALANLLIEAHNNDGDFGSQDLLERYQRTRRFDNMAMAAATDALVKLFSIKFPPVRWARQIGMAGVEKYNPVKRFFMKQAMGLSVQNKKIGHNE